MAEPAEILHDEDWPAEPDVSQLVTENDEPVDNIFSEMQMRLLVEALYASWPDRKFKAFANVALFFSPADNPVVPDVMVSMDVSIPVGSLEKKRRSYMVWEFGKPPEIAIEIVSDRDGGEEQKLEKYARIGVAYAAIYDPGTFLNNRPLRLFVRHGVQFVEMAQNIPVWLDGVDLGLTLWAGSFEGTHATWLRWCDREGRVLLTGQERADRLAAKLRDLGVDPQAFDDRQTAR